jgi:hypothetical protein
LSSVRDCLDNSVNRSSLPRYRRSICSAAAIPLVEAYRPSSSIRWYRNVLAKAFTSAESARVVIGATLSTIGVTTAFLPDLCRIVSGTLTVMLVALLMPPSHQSIGWRSDR